MKLSWIAAASLVGVTGCIGQAADVGDEPPQALGTTEQQLGETGNIRGIGGQCVDVQWGSAAAGTPVWMYPCHSGPAQQWRLTSTNEIRITGLGDKCLTAGASGTSAYIGNCIPGWEKQQWWLSQQGSIRSFDGRCLDVAWAGTSPQTPLVMNTCNPALPNWPAQVFNFSNWSDRIGVGGRLPTHQSIRSRNGVYRLIMQSDCNLVLYQGATKIWASNTYLTGSDCVADMQGDGNFVVRNSAGAAVFESRTYWRDTTYGVIGGGREIVVQDDGNVVVYGNYKRCFSWYYTALWSSRNGSGALDESRFLCG